jgi:hypothetical protein
MSVTAGDCVILHNLSDVRDETTKRRFGPWLGEELTISVVVEPCAGMHSPECKQCTTGVRVNFEEVSHNYIYGMCLCPNRFHLIRRPDRLDHIII